MPRFVTVEGLKEANQALKRLPDPHARREVQQTMDATAFQVSRFASGAAPRSHDGSHGHPPGFMANSIDWDSRPRSLTAVVTIARQAFYWKFLEFGTRFISARPFLRPAADRFRLEHRKMLVEALTRASSKMAKEAKHG